MGGDKDGGEVDQRLVRALAHPLRVEIFRILERGPKSPKRISDEVDEPLGIVSYHMKVLLDYDFVELIVDETGWEELRKMLGEVEVRFRTVGAKSAKRLGDLTDGVPLIVALGAFETARGLNDG
jgi:DNA-binding transcriptional ArsR family regulator